MGDSAPGPGGRGSGTTVAYVGAYTDRGKGIHLFRVDPADGGLVPWKVVDGPPNPSALAFAPSRKVLYAVNERSGFGGGPAGSVAALAVDPASGDLRPLNTVSSGGAGPTHLSVDPAGRFVYVANYGAGSTAVLPVRPDGSLDEPSDVRPIVGPLGPQPARDAPPGSYAVSGHDAPHAHMAQIDPGGRFLLVCDLGTDRIYAYAVDHRRGTLTPAAQPFVQASPGAGPRHLVFHPGGGWLYSLNEESSTLDVVRYAPESAALTIRQSVSTLPAGFAGTNYPSEIAISADGRTVYAANRLHDTIALFAVDAPGDRVTPRGHVWTRGSYPRHMAIEPSGRFMYVLHSRSDNITTFAVAPETGDLSFTGKYTPVGNPSQIAFLDLSARPEGNPAPPPS